MISLYKKFNWLSLDVVIGAMAAYRMAALLADGFGLFQWQTAVVLGLVVFIIYGLDRIIDNRNIVQNTARHQFRNQHKILIIRVLIGCLIATTVLLFWLPKAVIFFGIGLFAFVVGYLLMVSITQSKGWFEAAKDVIVPLVYALGVWGIAAVPQPYISQESLILFFPFWLIAQQNLLIIAYFESFEAEDGESLPIILGEDSTKIALNIIFLLVIMLCFWVIMISPYHYAVRVAILLIVMATIQHFIWKNPQRWLENDTYRLITEGVFLIPLLA